MYIYIYIAPTSENEGFFAMKGKLRACLPVASFFRENGWFSWEYVCLMSPAGTCAMILEGKINIHDPKISLTFKE